MDTILLSLGLFATWLLLPLIPATVIYILFPNTPVTASGPLAGLQVNTGGAFAAYLIIVLLGTPLVNTINNRIDYVRSQIWRVSASLELHDAQDRPIPLDENDVVANLTPSVVDIYDGALEVTVRRDEAGRFPRITVVSGCRGDPVCIARPTAAAGVAVIDLNREKLKRTSDLKARRIEITDPVVMRPRPTFGRVAPPPPAYTDGVAQPPGTALSVP